MRCGRASLIYISTGALICVIISFLHIAYTPAFMKLWYQTQRVVVKDDVSFRDGQPTKNDFDKGQRDNTALADKLKTKIRVLCWVMTSPKTLQTKAIHVRDTWARRCTKTLFISSEANDQFPAVGLNVSEGRKHLTSKSMSAFRYIYENHFNVADWFVKADDDTYMILENLRYFLSNRDPYRPVFYGQHFHAIVHQGYFSGGAGYILSKEALRRLYNHGSRCRQDGGSEDVEIGRCMEKLGVEAGNSTDKLGRSRFHCFEPGSHVFGKFPQWYIKYDGGRANFISDYAISFHYVTPRHMYALEYLIYHLRAYGVIRSQQELNQ